MHLTVEKRQRPLYVSQPVSRWCTSSMQCKAGAPVQCTNGAPVQCNANPSSVHLQYLQYPSIYSSALKCIKAIHRSDIGATHGHTLCLHCIALCNGTIIDVQFMQRTAIRCVHTALVFCHHRRDLQSSLSNALSSAS